MPNTTPLRVARASVFLGDIQNLLAAVMPVGADMMSPMGLPRGLVDRQGRSAERVMRTALTATGGRNSTFLDCHVGLLTKMLCKLSDAGASSKSRMDVCRVPPRPWFSCAAQAAHCNHPLWHAVPPAARPAAVHPRPVPPALRVHR